MVSKEESLYSFYHMDNLLIVANWKSNKTTAQALEFLEKFSQDYKPRSNIKVVICPSYLCVPKVSELVRENNLEIEVGVQNISPFDGGAYTGEVAAIQASEFVTHAIIGHSERRLNFGETDEMVADKVDMAKKYGIKSIVCVSSQNMSVPDGAEIIAYEPIEAIGTGNAEDPASVAEVFQSLFQAYPGKPLLYGGSVTADNAQDFLNILQFGGFLVGGASLDPESFLSIIRKC